MTKTKKAVNAGVDALLGFEFQRNCALYLLLNNYDRFKGREFFLCIEHHDDFLFCYRSDCRDKIEEIHSYQAKKLSGAVWTINERFSEAVAKMLEVGNNLINDPAPKCQSYTHDLIFISNTDIKLNYKPSKDEKEYGKKEIVYFLNEQNFKCSYDGIPGEIQDVIDKKVGSFCNKEKITYHKPELDNLHIEWVDLPRRKKDQKDILVGLMCRNFPHVLDPNAAVELLLSLFREVEAVYNQGRVINLLDSSKRVEGGEIKRAIDVIETEQKTFNLWRNYSTELSRRFQVPIGIQNNHENHIRNTFELLKDMANREHQIIKSFIRENDYSMDFYSHEDMFYKYVSDIKDENSMNLKDVDIFFSVLCAYVECHGGDMQ
ncbi:dsDNA nuclease domain-containing protein [Salinicola aestuarinus]|uniref:dsDNA nuclease domain-containing protein n=1 Tax=Salinicola aestuarinus TaxID=1949082 RepID=UPI000DA2150C|nr:dsDNA nuclease domain-containing protein [Salinicola aestuarinus]